MGNVYLVNRPYFDGCNEWISVEEAYSEPILAHIRAEILNEKEEDEDVAYHVSWMPLISSLDQNYQPIEK